MRTVPDSAMPTNLPGTGDNIRIERIRLAQKRNEAILIKVDEGKKWIATYKIIVGAEEAIKESTGVGKLKPGIY
jgi:hypothetical protein